MSNAPECFGKSWDESAVECSGGLDPMYVGLNGSKTRERCGFFQTCRTRTALSRQNEQQQRMQQFIPPSQLVRGMQATSPAPATQPAWRPPSAQQTPTGPAWQSATTQSPQYQQWLQQQQQAAWMQQQQQMPWSPPWAQYPQQFQAQAQLTPIAMMPQSYDMPSYLSVTEDREKGSFWTTLLHELLRGAGKAAGHSIANYFDKVRFRR